SARRAPLRQYVAPSKAEKSALSLRQDQSATRWRSEMTEPAGIEKFYGAAIHHLRGWVCRWSQRKLAKKAGVSGSSISNYERGEVVPSPAMRAKIAAAFGASVAGLDRLAAAIQAGMIGLFPEDGDGIEAMALEVAADLGDDFRRESLPLVLRFLTAEGA